MTDAITIKASRVPDLSARVLHACPMTYADDPSDATDHHPHVRAASGMTRFHEYLAVVQDDANWLALIDEDDAVHALPLPPRPESGSRIFSSSTGNKHDKFDLEACIVVPGDHGPELIGFGSGSHPGREWVLRVHGSETSGAPIRDRAVQKTLGIDLTAEFVDATLFYDSLRDNRSFSGAGLNLEGAVLLDEDTIRLFQRGNAPSRNRPAIDATGDVSWRALLAHLSEPETVLPPAAENIRVYDLGLLDGVRLTFSDAELLDGGRILYSASAESEAGEVVGSALGIIEPDGAARWTELIDLDGSRFGGKIEGLSLHRAHPGRIRFVIDDDDEDLPSVLYDAEVVEHDAGVGLQGGQLRRH